MRGEFFFRVAESKEEEKAAFLRDIREVPGSCREREDFLGSFSGESEGYL